MPVGYGPIIIIIVFMLLIGVMPIWPYARRWGYRPTIILGIIFLMICVFIAIGGFAPSGGAIQGGQLGALDPSAFQTQGVPS